MKIITSKILTIAILATLAVPVYADVKIDEKSLVTFTGMLGRIAGLVGGNAAKQGVTSMVAVKGDRKSRMNELTGEIIDLGEEKVYALDVRRKTYTVTTFDELRRRLQETQAKAQEEARKAEPAEAPKPDDSAKQIEVDFTVKDTGQKKAINGFDTHQVIATVTAREKGKTLEEGGGLVLTSDMWLTPTVKSLREITDFDRRYYQKIAGPMIGDVQQMAAAMAMYPFLKDAMGKLQQESAKADGTAVMTTLTIESVKSKAQMSEQQSDAAPSSPTSIGGLLGGLGRRAARRNQSEEPPSARSTFMTSTHEVLKVSSDVAASDLAIPAGFTEKK